MAATPERSTLATHAKGRIGTVAGSNVTMGEAGPIS